MVSTGSVGGGERERGKGEREAGGERKMDAQRGDTSHVERAWFG